MILICSYRYSATVLFKNNIICLGTYQRTTKMSKCNNSSIILLLCTSKCYKYEYVIVSKILIV